MPVISRRVFEAACGVWIGTNRVQKVRTSRHDLQDRIIADIHKIMNAICHVSYINRTHVRRTEKCVDNAGEAGGGGGGEKNTDFSCKSSNTLETIMKNLYASQHVSYFWAGFPFPISGILDKLKSYFL